MEDQKNNNSISEQPAPGGQKGTPEYNTDFMKEEIRQRPVNKKRLLRRTVMTVCLAALFGAVACAVFLVLEPVINKAVNPAEEPAPVTFTEGATADEMNPEDMIASDEQIQEQAAEEKAASSVDTIKKEVLREVEKELALREKEEGQTGTADSEAAEVSEGFSEDLVRSYQVLQNVAENVQKSVVTVTGITPDYDWVGDAFSDTGSGSGVIIAQKGTDLLILANNDDADKASEIRVTFHDGEQAAAKILCVDPVTDIVVLGVRESDLDTPIRSNDKIQVCTMGSSARSDLLGEPVIAVGSPSGSQGSVSYGMITNADLPLDVVDSSFTQITTDIYGSTQASGVLVDTAGEVIGWIDMDNNRSDSPNLISAVGITGIKPLIEKMSNETHAGLLGVHTTDVPENIRSSQGIPEGAYVIRTEVDSPAMEAGIQSGDVIVDIGGSRISSSEVLTSILGQSREGRQLDITVARRSMNGYAQVEMTAELTGRLNFPEQ